MAASLASPSEPQDGEYGPAQPDQTLGEALRKLGGDPPASMPLIVKLLENPASPVALPGNIDLYGHDCLHLLLNRGFSLDDEAFVIGFTMGNDERTNRFHLELFKLCSWLLYPKPYRFSWKHFRVFELGVACGRSVRSQNLNRFDFKANEHTSLTHLRQVLGIR